MTADTTAGMTVSRYKATRFWAVRDGAGALVCVCVYKRGADEVIRRLAPATSAAAPTPDPFCDPHLAYLFTPRSARATGTQSEDKENDRP